jgi:PD-(D/E)XK nuclease family transposase
MLANLDNEVIFKKAFTNKTVFKAFVRDILGIEIDVDVIETEKKFTPKVGNIDFELDIFAESKDKRIAIEIQRVAYDYHFDRFLHYFLMLIAEQQQNAKSYDINQIVYVIVILTTPYTIKSKDGRPILDEVLLVSLNPKTILGEERDLYGHQFVALNPNHIDASTPSRVRDWLDLIYQSIHNPQRHTLNTDNEGIRTAIELITFDNLTSDEIIASKNKEANKQVLSIYNNLRSIEIAKKMLLRGIDIEIIAEDTDLTIQQVQDIRDGKL